MTSRDQHSPTRRRILQGGAAAAAGIWAAPAVIGVGQAAAGTSPTSRCAGVAATTGDITVEGETPADVTLDAAESSDVQVFLERGPYVITSDVAVDFDTSDKGSNVQSATGGTIPPGTYCTYLLHFDPPGSTTTTAVATLEFGGDIAGGAVEDATMDNTDADHGHPGTSYFKGGVRSAEPGDTVTFDADGRTLRVDWTASTPMDEIRVWVKAISSA